jgi:hypothetical protein
MKLKVLLEETVSERKKLLNRLKEIEGISGIRTKALRSDTLASSPNKVFFKYKGKTYCVHAFKKRSGSVFYAVIDRVNMDDEHKIMDYNYAIKLEDLINTIGIKDARKEIESIKKSAIKLPQKPLKLKESFINARAHLGFGRLEGYSEKRFRGIIEELLSDPYTRKDDFGFLIGQAVEDWRNFPLKKAEEIIKSYDNEDLYDEWKEVRPKGVKEVKDITKKIKDKSTKLPKKELKLEWLNLKTK